jgi:battenin
MTMMASTGVSRRHAAYDPISIEQSYPLSNSSERIESLSSTGVSRRHVAYDPISIEQSYPLSNSSEGIESLSPPPDDDASKKTLAFFALGVLNNTSYVIMLAAAKHLSEGGTAVVYIVNVLPGLLVKLSAPYWFHRVSYRLRVSTAAAFMALAFVITGNAERQSSHNSWLPFVGVAFVSMQCALGEASLLAAAGKCDSKRQQRDEARPDDEDLHNAPKTTFLTAWASGTGVAGVVGYLWNVAGTEWLHISEATTLTAGVVLAFSYALIYRMVLWDIDEAMLIPSGDAAAKDDPEQLQSELLSSDGDQTTDEQSYQQLQPALLSSDGDQTTDEQSYHEDEEVHITQGADTSKFVRWKFILNLWPYIVPLFLVYAAEYACQSGAWTAMGFPLQDPKQRNRFYLTSNWLYQAGVFLSRSSGTLITLSPRVLWSLPLLQVVNLLLFIYTATQSPETFWFYNMPLLYIASIWTGLLGGAVYVHGYKRIVVDFAGTPHTELALATTSAAEGMGIVAADVLGLFLQGCLYQVHGLPGALVSCPF